MTDKQITAFLLTHATVPLADSVGHLARSEHRKRLAAEVDHIAHIIDLTNAERILAAEPSTRLVDLRPVHFRAQAVGRNRTDLQHIELCRTNLQIRSKLYLHRAFHLLLRNIEQRLDDACQRERVVF